MEAVIGFILTVAATVLMAYLEFLSRNEAPMRAVDPRWDVMSSAFGIRLAGKTPRDPEATRIAWGMRHGVDVEI